MLHRLGVCTSEASACSRSCVHCLLLLSLSCSIYFHCSLSLWNYLLAPQTSAIVRLCCLLLLYTCTTCYKGQPPQSFAYPMHCHYLLLEPDFTISCICCLLLLHTSTISFSNQPLNHLHLLSASDVISSASAVYSHQLLLKPALTIICNYCIPPPSLFQTNL